MLFQSAKVVISIELQDNGSSDLCFFNPLGIVLKQKRAFVWPNQFFFIILHLH